MSLFDHCRRDCFRGAKALQNVQASLEGFHSLCAEFTGAKQLALASMFAFATIRYAKPFLNSSDGDGGSMKYPTKHLKGAAGYSIELHDHLIEVRNALVAHDDFSYIEPRLLMMTMELSGMKIPFSITITNKCLGYPAELADAMKMRDHV